MTAALPAAKLTEVWNAMVAQMGAFKGQAGSRAEKVQGNDVVIVTCEFERGKADLQIAFNASSQVSGLYVLPAKS